MVIGSAHRAVVKFVARADLIKEMDKLQTLLFSFVVSVSDDVS